MHLIYAYHEALLHDCLVNKLFGLQEEVALIEGQVAELKGLVQQQDALNATLQQRVHSAAEAESRAKVTCTTVKSVAQCMFRMLLLPACCFALTQCHMVRQY